MITLYTKPNCFQCEATKKELVKKGIEFKLVDLTKDEIAFDKVSALGYRSAPVVYIEENNHWAGFQVDKLDQL